MNFAKLFLISIFLLLSSLQAGAQSPGSGNLDIYVLDTDGGESVLYVAPTGETLLFDTGLGDAAANARDFKHILRLVEELEIGVLDYVIISHNHRDHVGNAASLPELPVRNIRQFLDHGPYTTELQPIQRESFERYLEIRNVAKARRAEPGERLMLGAVEIYVVASSGESITNPLPGAGAANPLCSQHVPKLDVRGVENDEVVGVEIRYGVVSMLELSDMTWNQEQQLVCPGNFLGDVDYFYLASLIAVYLVILQSQYS